MAYFESRYQPFMDGTTVAYISGFYARNKSNPTKFKIFITFQQVGSLLRFCGLGTDYYGNLALTVFAPRQDHMLEKCRKVLISFPKSAISGRRTPVIETQHLSCHDNCILRNVQKFGLWNPSGNVDRRLEYERCVGVIRYPTNRRSFSGKYPTGNRAH